MLSPNPIVKCGGASLPFEAFVHLDDVRRGYVRPEGRELDNAQGPSRFLIRPNAFQNVLTDYPEEKPRARAGATSLAEYACLVDQFGATDPRDKIYGLLGLAMPADVRFLAPDYSQSVADVCTFCLHTPPPTPTPLPRRPNPPYTSESCLPAQEESKGQRGRRRKPSRLCGRLQS